MLLGCDCFRHDLSILAQIIERFARNACESIQCDNVQSCRVTTRLLAAARDAKIC